MSADDTIHMRPGRVSFRDVGAAYPEILTQDHHHLVDRIEQCVETQLRERDEVIVAVSTYTHDSTSLRVAAQERDSGLDRKARDKLSFGLRQELRASGYHVSTATDWRRVIADTEHRVVGYSMRVRLHPNQDTRWQSVKDRIEALLEGSRVALSSGRWLDA